MLLKLKLRVIGSSGPATVLLLADNMVAAERYAKKHNEEIVTEQLASRYDLINISSTEID